LTTPAIEVDSLSMRYPKVPRYRDLLRSPFHRDHVQALDGVSFTVDASELFAFLGPNGAGKTTLIKILTTLVLPTSGRARVAGADVIRDADGVKRRIGVVMSDERSFYWRLTGRQNLAFFATLHGLPRRDLGRRIDEMLDILGMADKADERFHSYSSGIKQKLAIARGLLADPAILFFDEPTRSLDPISAAQIRTFIRERLIVELGKTVFLTTHNLHEAEEISDRVGIINRGRLLAAGTVAEISARLRSREHYRLLLAEPSGALLDAFRRVPGVIDARRDELNGTRGEALDFTLSDAARTVPELIALAVSRGARILECARRESNLVEIFSEIINEDTRRGDAS